MIDVHFLHTQMNLENCEQIYLTALQLMSEPSLLSQAE